MLFAATQMDLEIIILSEWYKSEKDKSQYHLYVESKKMIQMNLWNRKELTDIEKKLMVFKWGSCGGDRLVVWD